MFFRKSAKFGPVRVTASKRGLGYSVGAGPVRLTRGASGRVTRTVRVPGTGIYDRTTISPGKRRSTTRPRRASSTSRVAKADSRPPSRLQIAVMAVIIVVIGLVIALTGSVPAIVIGVVVMLFGLFLSVGMFAPNRGDATHPAGDTPPNVPPLASSSHPHLPQGWYPDQVEPGRQRYWDGSAWTSATRWPPGPS